jgi:hypothetical protein
VREIWNREQLYAEVWEKPLVKIAVKYGISAVMLGKICRKLLIPLPGRGYWAKKEFGKPVERLPLPEAEDLPVLYRSTEPAEPAVVKNPEPEPTDAEYLRIQDVESRSLSASPEDKPHKLVNLTQARREASREASLSAKTSKKEEPQGSRLAVGSRLMP